MAIKLSYAVTSHNEGPYLRRLLEQLSAARTADDEIVLLDDFSDDPETVATIKHFGNLPDDRCVRAYERHLERNFARQKNYLNSLCQGQYIFQIDADELVAPELLADVHVLLKANAAIDLFFVPRINTVEGLTQDHITRWGWTVDARGRINWPDYQTRLYRNSPNIVWEGAVDERIAGAESPASLPPEDPFCLIHHKTIQRQEVQNEFYYTINR